MMGYLEKENFDQLDQAIERFNRGESMDDLNRICDILKEGYDSIYASSNDNKAVPAIFLKRISTTPVRISFKVFGELSKGFTKDCRVKVKLFGEQFTEPFSIDKMYKPERKKEESVTIVDVTVPRREMDRVVQLLFRQGRPSLFENCSIKLCKQLEIVQEEATEIKRRLSRSTPALWLKIQQMYGKMNQEPSELCKELIMNVKLSDSFSFSTVCLQEDQKEALRKCCSKTPTVCVEAPYGTGKTFLATCLVTTMTEADPAPVIVVAATNSAIAQFAEYISESVESTNVKAVRFLSDNYNVFMGGIRMDHSTTPVDFQQLLKKIENDEKDRLCQDELAIVSEFNKCREYVQKRVVSKYYRSDGTLHNNLNEKELRIVKKFEKAAETAERLRSAVLRILLKIYKPNVMLFTIDSLLCNLHNSDIREYAMHTRMVIVDEASQVLEISYLILISIFQKAYFRFFGDSKQLDPYTGNSGAAFCVPILERLRQNNQYVEVMLKKTYRSHPSLNEVPNKLIYGSTLIDGTNHTQRNSILKLLNFPNRSKATILIDDIDSVATRNEETGSWFNKIEMRTCFKLIDGLIQKGVNPDRIMIICYYSSQKNAIEQNLKHKVEVATVDSIQGREKDVVILLTTKTAGEHSDFLTDPKRCGVALTRAREALFILGKVSYLSQNLFWDKLIKMYFANKSAILATQIKHCFSEDGFCGITLRTYESYAKKNFANMKGNGKLHKSNYKLSTVQKSNREIMRRSRRQ